MQKPEIDELGEDLNELNKESDKGAALNAAAVLDDWLGTILQAFLAENKSSDALLNGFNAPLGNLSAKAAAAHSLDLIQDNEFEEITIIRKIRNEFGHKWKDVSFKTRKNIDLTNNLPWLGPTEFDESSVSTWGQVHCGTSPFPGGVRSLSPQVG